MDWRLTVRRLLISGFLLIHLSATLIWVLPPCPIRDRTISLVSYYMLPLGFWQYWTMFSPDPVRNTFTLEDGEVVDAKGSGPYTASKLADYSVLQGIPRFRHSKYAANLGVEAFELPRVRRPPHRPTTALTRGCLPRRSSARLPGATDPAARDARRPDGPDATAPFATYQFKSEKEVRP